MLIRQKYLFIMLFSFSIIYLSKAENTEFKFIKSEAVRFAKIAIKGENCDTVLELIFDESKGLGTGFDTLYILQNEIIDIEGKKIVGNKIKIKPTKKNGKSRRKKRRTFDFEKNYFQFTVRVKNAKIFNSKNTDLEFTISALASKTTGTKLNHLNRKEFDCSIEISNFNLTLESKIKSDITLEDAPTTKLSDIPKIIYEATEPFNELFCEYYMEAGDFTISYFDESKKDDAFVDIIFKDRKFEKKEAFQIARIVNGSLKTSKKSSNKKEKRFNHLSSNIKVKIPNNTEGIYRLISSFKLPFYNIFVLTNDIKINNGTSQKSQYRVERKIEYLEKMKGKNKNREKQIKYLKEQLLQFETKLFTDGKVKFDEKKPPNSYIIINVEIDAGLTLINYVSKTGKNYYPYTSIEGAATDIQDAVHVANPGNTILVNDGIYQRGGRYYYESKKWDRVHLDKNIILKSINGPENTFIVGRSGHKTNIFGAGATRCVSVLDRSEIHGFTISNGFSTLGGGIYCEDGKVFNCIIAGNIASDNGGGIYNKSGKIYNSIIKYNTAQYGGGIFSLGTKQNKASVYNCVINNNKAVKGGGVLAQNSLIRNCTIFENESTKGGGIFLWEKSVIRNSIIYFNKTSDIEKNSGVIVDIDFCCIPFFPKNIYHNITNPPAFFEKTFYLSESSPCINAGNNSYVISENDISGRKRIYNKKCDIGASEFIFAPLTMSSLQKNISNDISKISLENQEKAWNFIHKAEKNARKLSEGKFPLSIKTFSGKNYNFHVKKHSAYNKKILETYLNQIYQKFGIKNK